jgi:hypothetical protein
MFKHVRVTGIVAGATVVMLAASPSFAAIDKCSKLINGEVLKMQATFAKGFSKCNDAYQKDAKKPPTPAFSKAAPACQKELTKDFATLDKETAKLASKVDGKTCIDADLIALGHLPTSTFGTRWAQTQGVGALQSAYEQLLQGQKDWQNILITLGDTGSCATCAKLATPPCNETSCKLGVPASEADVNLNGSPTIVVPLAGKTVLKVCDVSTLISSASGVLYVVGGPAKILDPAPVGAIATACTTTTASEGLIQCGSGASKINYTTCIDHNTGGATNQAGATSSGACTGGACAASTTDIEDPTVTNGGVCLALTAAGGSAGDAYINLVSRIALWDPGTDCVTGNIQSAGTPATTALTTGTAQATVKNADDSSGATIASTPITGSVFNCATLARGDGGAVKLVGAFPAVNTLQAAPGVLLDSTTGFQLQCE